MPQPILHLIVDLAQQLAPATQPAIQDATVELTDLATGQRVVMTTVQEWWGFQAALVTALNRA